MQINMKRLSSKERCRVEYKVFNGLHEISYLPDGSIIEFKDPYKMYRMLRTALNRGEHVTRFYGIEFSNKWWRDGIETVIKMFQDVDNKTLYRKYRELVKI